MKTRNTEASSESTSGLFYFFLYVHLQSHTLTCKFSLLFLTHFHSSYCIFLSFFLSYDNGWVSCLSSNYYNIYTCIFIRDGGQVNNGYVFIYLLLTTLCSFSILSYSCFLTSTHNFYFYRFYYFLLLTNYIIQI